MQQASRSDAGTVQGFAPLDALLLIHGDVDGISEGEFLFQGARGTPRPIRVVRHASQGPRHDTAEAILALYKMDWNNFANSCDGS
jgi:hypothetical protein